MNENWVPERIKPGYYGGPSLKTVESQSVVTNGHVSLKDERDVSINYRPSLIRNDNFPARLSGKCVKGSLGLPRPELSKNQRNKLRRYGKVPVQLQQYCDKNGLLPEPILAQYI